MTSTPTSQQPGPYYTAPQILEAQDHEAVATETLAAMTVGSDLQLVVNTYTRQASNKDTWRVHQGQTATVRVEAFDSDGNFLTTLLVADPRYSTPSSLLALAVPVAERLFPNHLLTVND
jgi:hypothetical protein